MTPRTKAALLLLLLTAIWGLSYPMTRWTVTVAGMDPVAFAGFKFLFAFLALLPMAVRGSGPLPETRRGEPRDRVSWLRAGLTVGFFITFAGMLQFSSLVYTTSGKAAFIGGLYVVIVPLLAIAGGRMPGPPVWIGLVLGVSGLWLIAGPQVGSGRLNLGDGLMLLSATFTALHVTATARFANRVDPIRFVTVQVALASTVSFAIAFARGAMPDAPVFWLSLPVMLFGIVSLAGGILIQTTAQKSMRSSEVAMMLQLQGVFGAAFGMLFLDEVMTPVMLAGAALMVAGAIAALSRSPRKAETAPVPAAAASA
ncbi:MAG: DMT family transporter [Deltaproteobacteria bacterium]|jgi:drug/metabolite transporter (DMT)-like permease|nr:DMT family transporter [Deltaproteobacteria bacterium]